MLLRDGQRGVEVFLMRRVTQMKFGAGMHVFPGGRLDTRDADASVPIVGAPDARVSQGDAALARELLVCAVRETFEESGVLLASGAEVLRAASDANRVNVEAGGSLAALLNDHQLSIPADEIPIWSHWVTPEFQSRRFDTRFYVVGLPEGQEPKDVSGESDSAIWVRPEDGLRQRYSGEMPMMIPTATTLREISEFPSVAEVLAEARRRVVQPLLPFHNPETDQWTLLHAYEGSEVDYESREFILGEVDAVKKGLVAGE
ncbi:MAG: NUDIX domain-containing protein [Actinobacteria bacterium]|jgi:8-oxo-dGTP pyrophosphatase MutT (NUDIX family)|nr:NUDIX domain-containing protein [Actinomycetota bacterium]